MGRSGVGTLACQSRDRLSDDGKAVRHNHNSRGWTERGSFRAAGSVAKQAHDEGDPESQKESSARLCFRAKRAVASGDEVLVEAAKEVSSGAADHQCCRILTTVWQSRIGSRILRAVGLTSDGPARSSPRRARIRNLYTFDADLYEFVTAADLR
jgi:hypothetical protein